MNIIKLQYNFPLMILPAPKDDDEYNVNVSVSGLNEAQFTNPSLFLLRNVSITSMHGTTLKSLQKTKYKTQQIFSTIFISKN